MREPIYLVQGAHGEYDDYRTWIVSWHPTEDDAQRHVAALTDMVASLPAFPKWPDLGVNEDVWADHARATQQWETKVCRMLGTVGEPGEGCNINRFYDSSDMPKYTILPVDRFTTPRPDGAR